MGETSGLHTAQEPTLEELQEAFQEELLQAAQRGVKPLLESGQVSQDLQDKIQEQTQKSVRRTAQAYAEALHPFLKNYLDAKFASLSESIQQVLTTQVSAFTAQEPLGPGTVVTSSTSVTQSVINTLVTASTITVSQETGPSGLVLWRWNKTDVSQFDATVITSSNNHSGQLAYQASCVGRSGPSLVISASWTGTGPGVLAFGLNNSEVTLPERFIVWWRVVWQNKYNDTTETMAPGPWYHNGSWAQGTMYGFGATISETNGIEGVRCEGSGATVILGTDIRPFEEAAFTASPGGSFDALTYPGTSDNRTVWHEATIKQPVSASTPPVPLLNFTHMDLNRQINWSHALIWNPFAGESEPNAQWRLQTCNKFGIVVRRKNEASVGTFNSVCEIAEIIITKHPWDW